MTASNQPILDDLDPDVMDRLVSRRTAIRKGVSVSATVSAGMAMGSVPVMLAALSTEAFAQTPSAILDVLQFAYLLENLENEFYRAVLGTSAVAAQNAAFAEVRAQIPASAQRTFSLIQRHEQQHTDFLGKVAIPLFGGRPPSLSASDFDFTGGNGSGNGPFLQATTRLDHLLLVAQAVEDTGVRAYKGQAGRLLINGDDKADVALESALRIHSVEARHAAKIRRIRRSLNMDDMSLRFSGYVRGGGVAAAGAGNIANPPAGAVAALGLIYGGEDNTVHTVFDGSAAAEIDAATLSGMDVIGNAAARRNAAMMAFDEPLTKDQVVAIVRGFIKDDSSRGLP